MAPYTLCVQIEVKHLSVLQQWSDSEQRFMQLSYLCESNVGALLTETLTADVQAVLSDETSLVCADTAVVCQ